MATALRDQFLGDDLSGQLPAGWNLLFGQPSVVDHAVVNTPGGGAPPAIVAVHNTELASVEMAVCVRVSIDASVPATDSLQLFADVEMASAGSPDILTRAYIAELKGDGSISIQAALGSGAPPDILATCAAVLLPADSHLFIFKVRTTQRGTHLEVFVDDEVTPVLDFTDRRPGRPEGLRAGFCLTEPSGTGNVAMTDFQAYTLRSSLVHVVRPPIRLMTLADLAYHVAYRLDRAGNSQMDRDYLKDFVNFAQDEVYNELLPWRWAFREMSFVTKAGVACYELPAYVAMLYDVVNSSLGMQLAGVREQDLNRTEPARDRTGGPYAFTVTGRGDFGGLVVRMNPTPSGQAVILLPYYARSVPMTEDNDIPLIPPNWLEILIFGALKRASQYDTDGQFYQECDRSWERMMNRMKRANYSDVKSAPRIRVDNDLMRDKAVSVVGPVLRSQQLGL
jgi:hypothetical protein